MIPVNSIFSLVCMLKMIRFVIVIFFLFTLKSICLQVSYSAVCVAAVCSGEITDSAGVVLSPNWPETYDKGQDCIWGIHVEEDKRIMLDIQV